MFVKGATVDPQHTFLCNSGKFGLSKDYPHNVEELKKAIITTN